MTTQHEVADVIKSIQTDVTTIVKGEIELAKAEMIPQAKSVGIGAGMFGAAGYFAINAASLIYVALAMVIAAVFNLYLGMAWFWALAVGFGIMALLLLIIAGILAMIGKNKVQVEGPKRTVAEGQASVDAVKGAVSRGQEGVQMEVAERKALRSLE